MTTPTILLTGATGYVGGRLLRVLCEAGHGVRCMARDPEALTARWGDRVEVQRSDVLEPESLPAALNGIRTAYYLIHSMGSSGSFEAKESEGARNFARAARAAGVERIIYLGGLADASEDLSAHMRSRHVTGRILREESDCLVLEFRASIVLGSNSLSFEMIRALVQRLPVMITPRWVQVEAQPIAIRDLLAYLEAALTVPCPESRVFEIGGSEVISYAGIMREYARQRGLKRVMLPVPWLSPRLSSLWLGLVTPLFARVGRSLIESVKHPSVVRDPSALTVFPIRPCGVKQAIQDALTNEDRDCAESHWSDSLTTSNAHRSWAGVRFGTRLVDSRVRCVAASPEATFAAVTRIGGRNGWYYANVLWRVRGALDELVGGVGMRRGRRDPVSLRPGDVLDCWRVERIEPRLLRLKAEMKLPGRAWLEFEVGTDDEQRTTLRQTAVFDPLGLGGLLYWYSIFPLHGLIFRGMLRGIARHAET